VSATHLARLLDERNQLDDRYIHLMNFISSELWDKVNPEEQSRLSRQAKLMDLLLEVLDERLKASKD